MVIVIVAVILFGLGLIILKYNVEGETNMPFKLGKVRIVYQCQRQYILTLNTFQ